MVTEYLSLDILRKLPKAELHCHLDGSARPETVWELAQKQCVELPAKSLPELIEMMHVDDDCESLVEYLRCFAITLSVMQEPDSITRIMYEVAEDAARDGIRYLEVRFSPMLHTQKNLELSSIMEAVCEGAYLAEYHHHITVRIIVCGMRHESGAQSRAMAEIAWRYKDKGVCAFDLAGPENGFPSRDHKEAFDIVRKRNVNCTLHAGEAAGPESIRDALRYCGAQRIGHGTRLREDPHLFQFVLDSRIPLEMCPTSNVHTKTVNTLEDHPIADYLRAGIVVVPCTDNVTVSNIRLSDEYNKLQSLFDLKPIEILRLVDNGFRAAFLDASHKKRIRVSAINDTLRIFKEAGVDVDKMVQEYAIPMLGSGWSVTRPYSIDPAGLSDCVSTASSDDDSKPAPVVTTPPASPRSRDLGNRHEFTEELVHGMRKVDNHVRLDRALSEEAFLDLAKKLLNSWDDHKSDMKEYISGHHNQTYAIRKTAKFKQMKQELKNALSVEPVISDVHNLFTISSKNGGYQRAKTCITAVLQTEEALRVATHDIVKQADTENIAYMEVHLRPAVHTYLGLSRDRVVEIVLDELKVQRNTFPKVVTNLIIGCSVKEDDPVEFFETAQLALRHRISEDEPSLDKWVPAVVAFSFHGGDITNRDGRHYERTVNLLKDHSFPMTVSCGRNSIESIEFAIHYMNASRLSGCYTLHNNPELLELIATNKVNIEIAETEHFRRHCDRDDLAAFTASFYRLLIDNHVSLSLVSISPMFREDCQERRTTMTHILKSVAHRGFTPAHLVDAMITSAQSTFLPYQVRNSLKTIIRESAHKELREANIQLDPFKWFNPPL